MDIAAVIKNALNLYAGLGGNRRGWDGFGFNVTAVEKDSKIAAIYQANFPNDTVIIGDAHDYLLRNYHAYDFIWTSPPCQSHSRMQIATRHDCYRYPDMALYQEIILLQNKFGGYWVVENVIPYYEALIPAQQVGRHLFWSNFLISANDHPSVDNMITSDSPEAIEHMKKVMGIEYKGNVYIGGNHSPGQALRNCVLPELSRQVTQCAIDVGRDLFSQPTTNSKKLAQG